MYMFVSLQKCYGLYTSINLQVLHYTIIYGHQIPADIYIYIANGAKQSIQEQNSNRIPNPNISTIDSSSSWAYTVIEDQKSIRIAQRVILK